MANNSNLTPWKPGQSGNPLGKPKGTKHLSSWIQDMLLDENYISLIRRGYEIEEYRGAPIKAMIAAQIQLAMNGNQKAFEVLAKYGYGSKVITDTAETNTPVPILNGLSKDHAAFMYYAKSAKNAYDL